MVVVAINYDRGSDLISEHALGIRWRVGESNKMFVHGFCQSVNLPCDVGGEGLGTIGL